MVGLSFCFSAVGRVKQMRLVLYRRAQLIVTRPTRAKGPTRLFSSIGSPNDHSPLIRSRQMCRRVGELLREAGRMAW